MTYFTISSLIGNFCNGIETCSRTDDFTCELGESPFCDDDDPCTIDFCNFITDQCEVEPATNSCDDGNAANGFEICTSISQESHNCTAGEPTGEIILHATLNGWCYSGVKGFVFDIQVKTRDIIIVGFKVNIENSGILQIYERAGSAIDSWASSDGWNIVKSINSTGDSEQYISLSNGLSVSNRSKHGFLLYNAEDSANGKEGNIKTACSNGTPFSPYSSNTDIVSMLPGFFHYTLLALFFTKEVDVYFRM